MILKWGKMTNTYIQLYAQIIFSPKGRQNLIHDHLKNYVDRYITGITKNKRQKPMIINGMPDHVHILIGFSPDIAISDLVRDIKSNSTGYINEKNSWLVDSPGSQVSALSLTVNPRYRG